MRPRRVKTCAVCGNQFRAINSMQLVCNYACAAKHKTVAEARREARKRKQWLRQADRADAMQKAQKAFNAFIRVQKQGPCISCGITTGQFHAGHFRTVAAAPQLRFNGWNCWIQCSQCNNHKSGNITEYRKALRHRLGDYRVHWLEQNNEIKKYDLEYLQRIARIFRKRTRIYKKIRERLEKGCAN